MPGHMFNCSLASSSTLQVSFLEASVIFLWDVSSHGFSRIRRLVLDGGQRKRTGCCPSASTATVSTYYLCLQFLLRIQPCMPTTHPSRQHICPVLSSSKIPQKASLQQRRKLVLSRSEKLLVVWPGHPLCSPTVSPSPPNLRTVLVCGRRHV